MNYNPEPFALLPAVLTWLLVFGAGFLFMGVVTLVGMLVSRGFRGVDTWTQELGGTLLDLARISPRRVWALMQLTVREAVRRKALYVFVVFAVLFMFAGWFLSGSDLPPEFQVKVYVSFVLRAISWLILPVVLFLSCWSIPEDIRLRSLHTVVTKPVRRLEVVLGRILGFTLVGTGVLVVMAAVGWFWIVRMLPEEAEAQLTCRQPVFGSLKFRDREGNETEKGINTGDVWEFHSYIEGGTKARAIWTFDNVMPDVLDPDGNLILESRFRAFRSWKGDMKRSLYFQYVLVNPETGLRVPTQLKTVNEFRSRTDPIPRNMPTFGEAIAVKAPDAAEQKAMHDLFSDVVSPKGQLMVEVSCIDPNQYMGMARPDLFIRTPDLPFSRGYVKAVLCIGMMMLLVVLLGVTASTFAKGPVAFMLTLSLILVGMGARDFMGCLVGDETALAKAAAYAGQREASQQGGGVFESIYRILTHMNPSTPLPEGPATNVMKTVDGGLVRFLQIVYRIIPDFDFLFRAMRDLAEGFNVRWDTVGLPCVAVTLGYFLPCLLLGNLVLRLRELESK